MRSMLMVLGLFAATVAAAGEAGGGYDPFSLAEGRLPVVGVADGRYEVASFLASPGGPDGRPCVVEVRGGMLTSAGAGSCDALWRRKDGANLTLLLGDALVVLRPTARAAGGALKVARADDRLAITGASADAVALWTVDGWVRAPVSGGRATLSPALRAALANDPRVAVHTDAGVLFAEVAASDPEPARGATLRSFADNRVDAPLAPRDFTWCTSAPHPADVILACVDTVDGPIAWTLAPDRNVVPPNTPFLVRVRHPVEHDVQVSLGGVRGTTSLGDRPSGSIVRGGDEGEDLSGEWRVHEERFAPRVPGDADLVVLVGDEYGAQSASVELIVEQTYLGAFRVGFGVVWGGAVDANYSAETLPGSAQAEVVALTRPGVDLDIVLGYAPYLDRGGRGENGCDRKPWCFNPMVGIGILSPTGDGVDFFKSLHVGAEWELTPAFSIGLTGVARRVQRLADGVHVGSPVDGSPLVTEGFGIGGGVVFNVSPDVFKVLATNGGGFVP